MVPAVLRLVCEVQSMREIKFRGKDSDNGKWRYGFYLRHSKVTLCPIYENEEEFKKAVAENDEHYIVFDGFSDWNLPRGFYRADVSGKTVGQYTGMCDSEGTEIYEGDIVCYNDEPKVIAIVKFGNHGEDRTCYHTGFYIDWIEKDYFLRNDIRYWIHGGKIKVIGNIYDNHDLLGGDANVSDT